MTLGFLARTSSGWVGRCPLHDDRRPSLSIIVGRDGRLVPTCFAGCDREELRRVLGLDDADPATLRSLAPRQRVGRAELGELHAYLTARWRALADEVGAGVALGYLHERFCLGRELALEMGLGYDSGRPQVERPAFLRTLAGASWLLVPLALDGRLVGLQARRLRYGEPRWVGPAGDGWSRVGVFMLGRPGPVVVCEGPSDALAAVGAGYASVVVRGAALAATPAAARRTLAPLLEGLRGREVLVAGDGDPAGRRFTASCVAALRQARADARAWPMPDSLDLARVLASERRAHEGEAAS